MADSFKALVVTQHDGQAQAALRRVQKHELPDGEVLVAVGYSSLNYKDALAVTGRGRIIQSYPMIPGIDLAGTVVESAAPAYRPGDGVILTGYGLGESHWGGFAQVARVKAEWLVPLPSTLSLHEAMGIGTAGFTAMLSVMALEDRGLQPNDREVLVTGAAGGVGSLAVALLATHGYRVAASTGRPDTEMYLRELGASRILHRSELTTPARRALEHERWAGAIDSVGGETLASILRSLARGASVAACGLTGGSTLQTTVFPFLLRGVAVLGIASSMTPQGPRLRAWDRLARDLPRAALHRMIQVARLEDVPSLSQSMLRGEICGRTVIDPNAN